MLGQMATDAAPGGRAAGIILALCMGLAILAIAYHPSTTARAPAELMSQIVRLASLNRLVHGVFFVVLGGLTLGVSVFARRQGFNDMPILAGSISFALGIAAACGAVVLDGFLIPDIASRYLGSSMEQGKFAAEFLAVCALTIQILGKLSIVALSIAILLWSLRLIRAPGGLRAAGIAGLLSGVVALVLVATGTRLTPHSLSAVIVLQAIWYVSIGALLIRGRL